MASGRATQKDQDLALTSGAHRYLIKPMNVETLKTTVIDLLGLDDINVARDAVVVSEKARMQSWIETERKT